MKNKVEDLEKYFTIVLVIQEQFRCVSTNYIVLLFVVINTCKINGVKFLKYFSKTFGACVIVYVCM